MFEQLWWLDIVAPEKWNEVLVEENGEVIERFTYVLDNGKILMPELTQTMGSWISDRYRSFQTGNTQLSEQKDIIREMISKFPKHKSFNMVFDSSNDYILPYRWLGFRYVPSFLYRIDDLADMELLYTKMNNSAKKNIKSANNKTEIVEEDSSTEILDLIDKTYEVQGRTTPGKREMKEKIVNEVLERGSNSC